MIAETQTMTNHVRPDTDVLAEIETTLWQDPIIRTLDRSSLQVDVHNGDVFLAGHMASMRRKQVEDNVAAVPGVTAIHNNIVDDTSLTTAVALALASDPRTQPYLIRVDAFHGWIHLTGDVPASVVPVAEAVAAQVPQVRGVLELLEASGHAPQHPLPASRRPLQPMLGSDVYAEDVQLGKVSQVVINPRNRLVSHIAVRAEVEVNGRMVRGQLVIPVDAINLVNDGGVFLKETSERLVNRPSFGEEDFPAAPADWTPPFPYTPGSVRWPRQTQ